MKNETTNDAIANSPDTDGLSPEAQEVREELAAILASAESDAGDDDEDEGDDLELTPAPDAGK